MHNPTEEILLGASQYSEKGDWKAVLRIELSVLDLSFSTEETVVV